MIAPDLLLLIILGLWVSLADARDFRVPDQAIITGFAAIIALTLFGGIDPARALAGIGIALAQTALVRWITRRGLGLGDVKYAAFLGGLLGPSAWLLTGVLAGIAALAVSVPAMAKGRIARDSRIPFAPYLTCAAITSRIILGAPL